MQPKGQPTSPFRCLLVLQRDKNDDDVPEVAAALEGTLWSKQKRRRGNNKDDSGKKPGGARYKHFKENVRKKGSKKRT